MHQFGGNNSSYFFQLVYIIICVCLQGKVYMFDRVFKPNASQEKVYNEAAKSIVKGKSHSVQFKKWIELLISLFKI